MNKTSIEWTDYSVNPFKMQMPDGTLINVCIHKSDGCRDCYAEAIVRRWWKKEWGQFPGYTAALLKLGTPVLVEKELRDVVRLSDRIVKGNADPNENKIFWNDMTDEFLEFWPDGFIDKCYAVRALTPNLIHQTLTKRADRQRGYRLRLADSDTHLSEAGCWASDMAHWLIGSGLKKSRPDDGDDGSDYLFDGLLSAARDDFRMIHAGISTEDQKTADERIPLLLQTPAVVRWISAEPLLAPVNLESIGQYRGEPLTALEENVGHVERPGLDWVVVGGESGPGARAMRLAWAESIIKECRAANVPVFVKQLGSVWAQEAKAKNRKGGDPSEWPYQEILNVREFPKAA